MVVEDGKKRIALECDGERWHSIDDLPNDLKRQAILERLGWKFIRIRGSAFYRNPEETMKCVIQELDSHGIKPNFAVSEDSSETECSIKNETNDRIKRRAEQIRNEWHGEVVQTEAEEVSDENGKNILSETDLANSEISQVAEVIKMKAIERLEDRNTETIAKNSEKGNLEERVIPKPKINFVTVPTTKAKEIKMKADQLSLDNIFGNCKSNQLSLDDIIVERETENHLTDKPKFDFRK